MMYTSRTTYEYIAQLSNNPIIERRTCRISGQKFPIFRGEVELLQKLSCTIGTQTITLPLPTICPEERKRRRLTFRNTQVLYNDICDFSQKKTISRFHPDSKLKVYTNDIWSGDNRNPKDYGKEIDWGESSISQIDELIHSTPYQNLLGSPGNVANNSVYTNATADVVDCYLIFDAHDVEKSCYSRRISDSKHMVDCLRTIDSEYCYECNNCSKLYECMYCTDTNSSDHCCFMQSCQDCHFCIGCVNLIGKQYYLYNQPSTKEAYEQEVIRIKSEWRTTNKQFEELKNISIKASNTMINAEWSCGSNIQHSQNVYCSDSCRHDNNIRYCSDVVDAQDCMDVDGYGHNSFLMYNSNQVGRYSSHIYCSSNVGRGEYLFYCVEVKKSHHCFGCVNMKDASYCIFNKQYTKEEREQIVPKIINKMMEEQTWWESIDPCYSPFPYNDTDAQDIFPVSMSSSDYGTAQCILSDENLIPAKIQQEGNTICNTKRRTRNQEINIPDGAETISWSQLPIDSNAISDDILKKVVICESSGRPFRITPLELAFYRKFWLPIPRIHPDIRYEHRKKRSPDKKLHSIQCPHCKKTTLSVYSTPSPYIVCSDCYTKEIFW